MKLLRLLLRNQMGKQVGVEVELLKDSHSDVVADTHETPETHAVGEEPGLSFKTQKAMSFHSEVS